MTYEEYRKKKYNNDYSEQSSSQNNVSDNRYTEWKQNQSTNTQNKQFSSQIITDNDNRYAKWKETQRQLELERKQQEEQRAKEEAERIEKERENRKQEEQSKKQESNKVNVNYGKGNIDLNNRPIVKNLDGSISTVRSMSFNEDGKEILIPTVVNGKVVSDEEAITHYHRTGEYLGKFDSIKEADKYAEQLHEEQEKIYGNVGPKNNSEYYPGAFFRDVVEDNEAQNQNNSKDSKLEQILNDNSRNMRPKNAEEFGNGIQKGGDAVADLGYKAVEDVSGIIDNILLGATRGIKKAGDFAWNSGQSHARNAEERQKLIEEESKKLLKNRDDYDENYSPVNDFIPEDSPLQSLMSEAKDFKSTIEDTSKNIDKDIDTKINENIEKASDPVTKKVLEIGPSVGQMIPAVAGGGTPYLFTSAAGSYYDEGIQRGMSEDEALRYSGIMAGMETATESIQLGKVFKAGTKVTTGSVKSALKDYGFNLADNFIQEAIMEPISETSATVVAGSDKADWSNMPSRMLKEGVDGALVAVIMDGSTAGISSAKQVQQKIEHNETVTPEEIKQAVEDVQKSGKVDIESIVQREMQYQIDKSNATVDNNSETVYNTINESESDVNGQIQGRGMAGISENNGTWIQQKSEQPTTRQYTREEYGQWEGNIIPTEEVNLTDEQKELKNSTRRQYGKDIVFFDAQNNYEAGASLTDSNKIYINLREAEKFGINNVIYHEIAESNIYHNKDISDDIIQPAIEKIINDSNFEQQKQEFWKNQIDSMPSDYAIAKDILCDRFAEINSDVKADYSNVLSHETNMTIDYAIEKFDKELKNKTDNTELIHNQESNQNSKERIDSLEKEVAPIKSGLTTQEQQEKMMFDMYVQEKGYDSMDEDSKKRYEYLKSQVEENVANVLEDNTEVDSPLDDRNINDVGNRNVKAYEYINPEVKPFFQREADNMLGDLRDTIPAERYKVGNDEGYDSSRWEGTPRATVKAIAELKDDFGYSYDQIKKGLEAIKQDHGSENNAVSKRIEFKLDERLREGYTTVEGYPIPPNQEYINFLQEKEIHDYNKEAFESLRDEDYTEITNMDTQNEQPDVLKVEDLQEEKPKKLTRKIVRDNIIKNWGLTTDELSVGKDITSMNYQLTDPVRVNEKVFGYKIGQRINDLTINQTKHNTAEKTRWQNQQREEIKKLGIKARSKESAAVQKYGEKQFVDKHGDVHQYGDKELALEFPDVKKQEQIKKAAEFIRNKYDTYIDQINDVITALGYNEIPKRNDYMKHFSELGDIFSQTGVPFNLNDMSAEDLPTDINGLTEFNKPGKNWFASSQQRYGFKTTYDAITGIDQYLEGAGNLIYHTQDIQNYRALSTMIRDTYGQTKGFENLQGLSDEQLAKRISEIQGNKLTRYAAWLDEQANALAGKKGAIDRGVERALGRRAYTFFNTLKSQVGSNMTGFNVRSSLTNLISSTIAAAKTNKIAMVKGTVSTIQNMFKNDGFIDKSDFLTARFGSDSLSSKLWSKVSNAGQIFMTGTDYFTSNLITRSKYYEGLQKGMNESEAIKYADDFGARVMGDRSQGSTAEIFNSKTLGLFTQFQLEVNNQWQYMVHDTKIDFQKNSNVNGGLKAGATALFQMGQLAAFSYFFNEAFERLTGSRAAFDPVEILKTLLGIDDDDDEKSFDERLSEAGGMLADNIPFGNLFTGGGRIPISEALNGIGTLGKKLTNQKNEYGQDITWEDVGKDMLDSLPYYVLPTGYSQAKKTYNGLSMYNDDLPVHGSYTDSGNLRYTVDDDLGSKVKAGLFGAYANDSAQDYIDSGYKSIDKNHIQELKDLEMNSTQYRDYREGLSGFSKNAQKIDYVDSLDVTNKQKNIMANNIIKSDKFKVDMSDYDAFSTYDEFIFSYKYPGKYQFLKDNNIPYEKYQNNKDAYNHAIEKPEDYILSKSVTNDYEKYYKYTKDIAKIDAKDSTGKSVSGLKKQRMVQYVNKLPLSVGQKAVLLRKYYKTDSTYNKQIVEHISKQNLTNEEKQSTFKSLNMTLNSNGTVSWKK